MAHARVRALGRRRQIASGKAAVEDICAFAVRYDGPEEAAKVRPTYEKQARISYAMTIKRVYTKGL